MKGGIGGEAEDFAGVSLRATCVKDIDDTNDENVSEKEKRRVRIDHYELQMVFGIDQGNQIREM